MSHEAEIAVALAAAEAVLIALAVALGGIPVLLLMVIPAVLTVGAVLFLIDIARRR